MGLRSQAAKHTDPCRTAWRTGKVYADNNKGLSLRHNDYLATVSRLIRGRSVRIYRGNSSADGVLKLGAGDSTITITTISAIAQPKRNRPPKRKANTLAEIDLASLLVSVIEAGVSFSKACECANHQATIPKSMPT